MTAPRTPAAPVAHMTLGITPAGAAGPPETDRCERCDEAIVERICTHRDLCVECTRRGCDECAWGMADDARAEAAFERGRDDRA